MGERDRVKWVSKVFVIDKTNGFSLESIKDKCRAGATPDARAMLYARMNEASI